jgi:hypothetical protein
MPSFARQLIEKGPHTMLKRSQSWRGVLPLVLALSALLSACSSSAAGTPTTQLPTTATDTPTSGTGGGGSTPTTGSTPVSNVTPAPTPIPITTCAQVSGFASAGGVSTGANFTEVGFPANTVGFVKQIFETNSYQFEILSACTQGASAGYIRTYFTTGLPGTGFPQSSTFPYQGNASAACGDPYCWYKDGSHPSFQARRYISLENVTSVGSVATYDLRLSIAPLARTTTINGTFAYDFDLVSAEDVRWNQVSPTIRNMAPLNGATIVNIGVTNFANVTAAQLKGLAYSTTPIDGNNDSTNQLVNGDVFAVKTDIGHYVKVLVTSYGYNIALSYVLYDLTF